MRKALLVVLAVALLVAGGYLLFMALSHPNVYSILRGGGVAVIFVALGGYLLWDEFGKDFVRRTKA